MPESANMRVAGELDGGRIAAGSAHGAITKVRHRSCSCTKEDFLPEESFQSWGNYAKALGETGKRLVDRITTRSSDNEEINEVRARSGNEMKKNLTWWDLMWFAIGNVVGAGIFVLTGQEARTSSGPAVILSFVVSGIASALSVLCYTEFGVEIPVAGGSFAYLRVELGDFIAFIAAGNILLEYVIGNAAVARTWTSYFSTLMNHQPDDFRIKIASLPENYNKLDPIAVGITAVVGLISIVSTKASSRFNYIASIVHMCIIVFIIFAGLTKADTANFTPFVPFGAHGVFSSAAVLYFAYIGFDAVSTMAEETKNPGRDIPIGLVSASIVITIIYCLLAVTLCLMVPFTKIDTDAPFSVAFQTVGMEWAKYIVALGALKGMTTGLLVSSVGQARYLTHIARTHMVPPWFAKVRAGTGTPINAAVVLLFATAAIALFTDLPILANLISIATLFIFTLVAIALLVRRYYLVGETSESNRKKLIVCLLLILTSSMATAVLWGLSASWIGYVVTVPLWAAATCYLWLGVPQARRAAIWGVPLVPWLPSLSIFINIFLFGSIDVMSFMRFGIWTAVLLVYYFLFGLHASYDTAKATAAASDVKGLEDGSSGAGTVNGAAENK